ncbi:DUF6338 family protein [Paenarthrobacter sp. NPDC091711]|uniref:DUF6338 family protein n=1 Tax=Paenarthrobacter sp. NPDC091711 TaxID=3364385 RepID=UPI0037FBB9DF
MLPGSLWAALGLLGLVPGWIFLVSRERYVRTPPRSGLGELLQVSSAGLGLTGTAFLLWSLFSEVLAPAGFISLEQLGRSNSGYLENHPRHVVMTVAVILIVACLLALLLAWILRRNVPASYQPGSPWEQAFAGVPKGKFVWVGVQLNEGELIEGVLHSFDVAEATDGDRDIVLSAPIYVSQDQERVTRPLDRVVISSDKIDHISAIYVDIPKPD